MQKIAPSREKMRSMNALPIMAIIPDDDDVIYFVDPNLNPAHGHTATHGELSAVIARVSNIWRVLATEGAECRYLSSQGGGWKTGRTRLVFEFEEDEPEVTALLEPASEDNLE